ncbi:hypothetical protein [Streptomonospora salina]|uniref:Chorismate mutase n=1 Tax=Streptomonospora salina TaxID=104205 RepID=A0A841EFQ6_9ACTN|nr:hypothetical protein [Streptomonospora salina]MBB6000169.1 chorismate mutase [Streptomonospora salina]
MSADDFDRLLQELAGAAEALQADCAEAERRFEELHAASENLMPRICAATPEPGETMPGPGETVLYIREDLARNAYHAHDRKLREFVAWWAEVAALAVLAAVSDRAPNPVRVMAAEPSLGLQPEDLQRLPPIDESDRQLAELSLHMATAPRGADHDGGAAAETAYEAAHRVGLSIRRGTDGVPTLVEDFIPEAVRRRLWGAAWDELQAPLLPRTDELVDELNRRAVGTAAVEAVGAASQAVDAAREAASRIAEVYRRWRAGEEAEFADEDEAEPVEEQAAQLPEALAEYARVLSARLPEIRAAQPE